VNTQNLDGYSPAYYQRDIRENWFAPHGLLRPDQLAAVCYAYGWPFDGNERYRRRDPGRIMSIGCGRGDLEAELERMGAEVIGVDPSHGAQTLYRGTTLQPDTTGMEDCQTVLFVESIEHLPKAMIEDLWPRFSSGTRVVIVNWRDFHPIEPEPNDGWDHITLVDDDLFDWLCGGFNVWVRNGSHLVIDRW
jgi:hypothetical protein